MTKSRCLVSVITPMYNTERYVAECIGSVLNQTLRDVEVLVVDDGSRDRSAEIVEEIARRDNRVRLLRHPGGVNLGVSRSRHVGIMEASGEYIAYLDADDAFEPSKLEHQIDLLRAHPHCVLCHTGIKGIAVQVEDQELSSLLESQASAYEYDWNNYWPEITEYSFLDLRETLRRNVICNSSALVVTAAVRSAPAATRQIFQYEDWVQWVLLSAKGPFVFTPQPLTFYRVHCEASSFELFKRDCLKHLYSTVEFLLTINALTNDSGLKNRAATELLYNLARIMEQYADRRPNETVDSQTESTQSSGQFSDASWESMALELQSEVNKLQPQVAALSERLAIIRSSKVYRSLVKVRKLLNAIAPRKTET
jgi:glycosyltransferase involved in cell wall biosynthesis